MNLLTAIAIPALVALVTIGSAQVWRHEINAVLRWIERY
jgi:hypothetical protein